MNIDLTTPAGIAAARQQLTALAEARAKATAGPWTAWSIESPPASPWSGDKAQVHGLPRRPVDKGEVFSKADAAFIALARNTDAEAIALAAMEECDKLREACSQAFTEVVEMGKDVEEQEAELAIMLRAESSSATSAANILFEALGWKSGGLAAAASEIVAENARLRAEVVKATECIDFSNDAVHSWETENARLKAAVKAVLPLLHGSANIHREAASSIRDIERRIGPASTLEWIREQLCAFANQREAWSNQRSGIQEPAVAALEEMVR